MSLPIFKDDNTSFMLMQDKWASELNPVIANPLNGALVLSGIVLKVGTNVINHKLGRKMQGWFIVDIDAPAVIYRSAALNGLTVTLNSSAIATIALGVF